MTDSIKDANHESTIAYRQSSITLPARRRDGVSFLKQTLVH
jgi:hypothetical protein